MKSSDMPRLARRRFLGATTLSFAGPMIAARHVIAGSGQTPPGERIRVGAIGVGGRGSLLLQQLPESAELVALCDCNESRAINFRNKAKGDWPIYTDYHRILERQDIDAVIVATGEFQRILPCIEACQAGKDVYAEKPLSLYIQEGRALVKAVRRYERKRSQKMFRNPCHP